MDLVVDLGLGRFRSPEAAPDSVAALLVALVASGHTTLVREVIDLDEARVLEVAAGSPAPVERWLDAAAAAAIVAAVKQHFNTHGPQVRFSTDELRRLGVVDLPDLALVLDRPAPESGPAAVTLTAGTEVRLIDVDASLRTWAEKSKPVRRVASLLALAKKHRLIVHVGPG